MSNLASKDIVWLQSVSLAPYSTYKIGGDAKWLTKVKTERQLSSALAFCHKHHLDYYILGKGSNTLFDDRGFDGAVIVNQMNGIEQEENLFKALSGTPFSYLGQQTAKLGFAGLEYAAGIPGSVGGAVFMNAGANGKEVSDVIESVHFIHPNGEEEVFKHPQLQFDYRTSIFHQIPGFITKAQFKLTLDPNARARQIELIEKRKLSQPLWEASCGCTFRNGENFITGKLIDDLGLKGLQVGGAQISPKHANFIVNTGGATAYDVKTLVRLIEEKVAEKTSFKLQREIRYVPYSRSDSHAL